MSAATHPSPLQRFPSLRHFSQNLTPTLFLSFANLQQPRSWEITKPPRSRRAEFTTQDI